MSIIVCIKPSYFGNIGDMRGSKRDDLLNYRGVSVTQMNERLEAGTWRLANDVEATLFLSDTKQVNILKAVESINIRKL